LRPTDSSTFSALTVPVLSPAEKVTRFSGPRRAMPVTAAPVTTVTPAAAICFWRTAAISRSVPGTSPGILSRIVISVPMAERNWANSTPMTPPPTMTALFGSALIASTWLESSTSGPSIPSMGIRSGLEPEAIRTASPRTVSPDSRICTVLGSTKEAVPRMTFTFLAFSRAPTPRASLATTKSFRAITAPKSTSNPLHVTPNVPASFIVRTTAADWSRDLAGMHPRLRHVPPRASFSMRVTSAPRRAARIAAG